MVARDGAADNGHLILDPAYEDRSASFAPAADRTSWIAKRAVLGPTNAASFAQRVRELALQLMAGVGGKQMRGMAPDRGCPTSGNKADKRQTCVNNN